ncbi:hypothetical protein AGMMS50256_02860 [Betaproteobacteria bacterium]|nr:hypothetical protein AGMMS50256_02860 [Betaproteobacteria bacterium]
MGYRVVISESANRDLDEILTYIAEKLASLCRDKRSTCSVETRAIVSEEMRPSMMSFGITTGIPSSE